MGSAARHAAAHAPRGRHTLDHAGRAVEGSSDWVRAASSWPAGLSCARLASRLTGEDEAKHTSGALVSGPLDRRSP